MSSALRLRWTWSLWLRRIWWFQRPFRLQRGWSDLSQASRTAVMFGGFWLTIWSVAGCWLATWPVAGFFWLATPRLAGCSTGVPHRLSSVGLGSWSTYIANAARRRSTTMSPLRGGIRHRVTHFSDQTISLCRFLLAFKLVYFLLTRAT